MASFSTISGAVAAAAMVCVLAASGVAAQGAAHPVSVTYVDDQGVAVLRRAWYGDGRLYIGSTVPAEIRTAFNFTVPNVRSDLLYIEATPAAASASASASAPDEAAAAAVGVADPVFLALDDAPGTTSTPRFLHDATSLSDTDSVFWSRYADLLMPVLRNGYLLSYFYLAGTSAEGTYQVRWQSGGVTQPRKGPGLDGLAVSLSSSSRAAS